MKRFSFPDQHHPCLENSALRDVLRPSAIVGVDMPQLRVPDLLEGPEDRIRYVQKETVCMTVAMAGAATTKQIQTEQRLYAEIEGYTAIRTQHVAARAQEWGMAFELKIRQMEAELREVFRRIRV